MGVLAWLIPDEAAVLVVVAIGFAVMLGARRAAGSLGGLLLCMVLAPLFLPLIDAAVGVMPFWLLALGAVWIALTMFRSVLTLLVGRAAASAATGHLVATAVTALARLLVLPVRLLLGPRR